MEDGAICLSVVVCRAGVGKDVACARIKGRNGGIIDLLAMNCFQPVGRFDADALQIGLIRLDLRRAHSEDPLLGGLLHLPVKRGDDLVAAGVELLLASFGVGAENPYEEVTHAVDEVRGTHLN